MRKQILNEEFRRMQKLAGIITEAKTDVEKKQRLEALVDFFSQSGTGDEMRAIRNTYLHFKNNKDIDIILKKVLKSKKPEFINVIINSNQKIVPKLQFGKPIEDLSPLLPRSEFKKNMIIASLQENSTDFTEAN
jgi:hypothetical protein